MRAHNDKEAQHKVQLRKNVEKEGSNQLASFYNRLEDIQKYIFRTNQSSAFSPRKSKPVNYKDLSQNKKFEETN